MLVPAMPDPILYGAAYSVYTRVARLALAEKQIPHRLEEIDIFAHGGPPAGYLRRQPFGQIPAFTNGDFHLYETAAITRYVDEAFAGPRLQPGDARGRARMAQVIGVLDGHAYRAMVWDVFVERVRKPLRGEAPDQARIAAGLARSRTCLGVLEEFASQGSWLVPGGGELTLADLHAAPMIAYLVATPEGAALLAEHPRMLTWWRRIRERTSMRATMSPLIVARPDESNGLDDSHARGDRQGDD
jgi:glutathione S-transferase